MNNRGYLSTGEFSRSMEALERNVLDRFDQRFDRIEDRLTDHAERIVRLEAAKKKGNLKTAGLASAAGAVLVALIEGVKAYLIR